MSVRHLAKILDWRQAVCGHVMNTTDSLPTSNEDIVTCRDCLNIMSRRAEVCHLNWGATTTRCGAKGRHGSRRLADVTCTNCLDLVNGVGVGTPPPLPHTPPRMVDGDGLTDGVFIFHDAKYGAELDVRPQADGHVLFDIGGNMFYLHHLDRADLLRALLYDFHYSPERGGPTDDQL